MKKIVFCDIPMKEIEPERDAQCYAGTGNAHCTYGGKVIFPINAVLAEKLRTSDEVKVVLLKTQTGRSEENARLFQQELDAINAGIGAKILYEAIDNSDGFYRGHADLDSRSFMNVTFRLPNEELEKKFVAEAAEHQLCGVKGHRSVGGMRASIYNAMPIEGAAKLADFMEKFKKSN